VAQDRVGRGTCEHGNEYLRPVHDGGLRTGSGVSASLLTCSQSTVLTEEYKR
jgi:hypothetical protein